MLTRLTAFTIFTMMITMVIVAVVLALSPILAMAAQPPTDWMAGAILPAHETSPLEWAVLVFAVLLGTVAAASPTNRPIRRGKGTKEVDTRAFQPEQKPPIMLGDSLEEAIPHPNDVIIPVDKPLHKDYTEDLAFNEEPVTIYIHRSTEKFSPPCTDLVSVNGDWAEMWMNLSGKWRWVKVGYLPRGRNIIVKRKYAGELARAKQDNVETEIVEHQNRGPDNIVHRRSMSVFPFSVIDDRNPKGKEWLQRLVTSQA